MDIEKIDLEYASVGQFSSLSSDGVQHQKVLPYLSIAQAVEGSYDITLANAQSENTGVCGFFVAPSGVQQTIVHNADKITGRMTCRWVFLKVKINNVHYLDSLYQFPVILPESVPGEMSKVFDALFQADSVADQYICCYQIVKLLLQVAGKKEFAPPPYIVSTIAYLEKHYAEKITVEDMAKAANLSAAHFFAVFKKQMGVSPMAYLNHYRLSLAAELLLRTELSVTEIAASVGISDPVYFNKCFKKVYQIPPTQYRNT